MKVMKIRMLVNTAFEGQRLHVGDEVDVREEVAKRWATRGIGELIKATSDEDYSGFSAKQLYDMCNERGIEAEPKCPKETYIALLTAK